MRVLSNPFRTPLKSSAAVGHNMCPCFHLNTPLLARTRGASNSDLACAKKTLINCWVLLEYRGMNERQHSATVVLPNPVCTPLKSATAVGHNMWPYFHHNTTIFNYKGFLLCLG